MLGGAGMCGMRGTLGSSPRILSFAFWNSTWVSSPARCHSMSCCELLLFPSLPSTAVSTTLTTGHHLRLAHCTSPAPSQFLPPRDALLRSAGQKERPDKSNRKRERRVPKKDGVNSTGQMICCRFGKRDGRWEWPEKKTRLRGVGANGAFNVEIATVGAGTCGTVPWAQH